MQYDNKMAGEYSENTMCTAKHASINCSNLAQVATLASQMVAHPNNIA